MEKYYGIILLAIAFNIIYWKFVFFVFALLFSALYRSQVYIVLKNLPRDIKFIYLSHNITKTVKRFANNNTTVVEAFKLQLQKGAVRPCFYFEDEVWTFQDVENFSNRIANVFIEQGFKKHDTVALMMGNCPQYICIWLGLAKIGVRTALVNINLRSKSLLHCITVAKAKVVIYADEFSEAINFISLDLEQNSTKKYQYGGDVINDDARDLKMLMSDVKDDAPVVKQQPNFTDVMLYIFTSGTTGFPKAALMTHSRLINVVTRIRIHGCLSEKDIIYIPLPLFHTVGGCIGVGNALLYGNSIVLRNKFSASSYISDCIRYKTTVGFYVGEMCRYILSTPPNKQDKQHCMRTLLGIGMRTTIWENFINRFQIPNIIELYGATEGNVITGNINGKVGAVGCIPQCLPWQMIPFTIIKVNKETEEPIRNEKGFCVRCKPGEQGMIIGFIDDSNPLQQFHGYLNENATKAKIIYNVFRKGEKAFASGDLMLTDDDGNIYFKDRIGDTYRWKSENISTSEVEAVLMNITGLKGCVVYGVQVGDLEGKAGMATLADPNGELSLSQIAQDLHKVLPKYAMPVFIRISDSLPLTGTFKLQKTELQKEGFNPRLIKDKLYFLQDSSYVPLTEDLYEDILMERCRI